MERLAYLSPGETIQRRRPALSPGAPVARSRTWPRRKDPWRPPPISSRWSTSARAIARARGNMSDAAERLGLHRSNLYRKMRQLGMDVEE